MKGNVSAPFTTGSSAPESRADGWRDEGEKEKKEAYRERRLNPLRYHLSLGRPSLPWNFLPKCTLKSTLMTFNPQRASGCYSLSNRSGIS